MNKFNTVLSAIQEHCTKIGIVDKKCFAHIMLTVPEESYNSILDCLNVLESHGLIHFHRRTKGIVLTKKGNESEIMILADGTAG